MRKFYYIDGSVAMIVIAAFFVLELFLGKGKIMKKIWTKALAYVPFVSLMEFDVPFEGDILMFKAAK